MGVAEAAGAGLAWGLSAIFVSLAGDCPIVLGTFLAMLASTGIAAAYWVGAFVLHLAPNPLSTLAHLPLQLWVAFGAIGILNFPVTRVLNFRSIEKLGAARSSAFRGSAPIVTLLVSVLWLHWVPPSLVAAGSLGIVAGLLILGLGEVRTPAQRSGWIFGMASTIGLGILPIFINQADRLSNTQPLAGVLVAAVVGALSLSILARGQLGHICHYPRSAIGWFLLAGCCSGSALVGNWLALNRLSPSIVVVLTSLSPFWTTLLVRMRNQKKERLTPKVWMAIVLIVAGAVTVSSQMT